MDKNTNNKGIEVRKPAPLGPASPLPSSNMPVKDGQRNEHGKPVKPIKGPQYNPEKEIKKYGIKPTELVTYTDPVTNEQKSIMIDRRGTNEEKLALTLLDDKISREQKDSVLSLYLFEKGKNGASMLMDLWQSKGTWTKESRQFQSTMRFDFELFLQTFQMFMVDSAELIEKELKVVYEDVERDGKKVRVMKVLEDSPADIAMCFAGLANYFRMTSELLGKRIRAEVQKRERAKGKGIYIGLDNKPYSVFEDGDVLDVVQKDREVAAEQRADLITRMRDLSDEGIDFILSLGSSVTWDEFLEEWKRVKGDKDYARAN